LGVELEDQVIGSVGDAVDLLENHVSFRLQIALAEEGAANQISEDLDRQRQIGVEHVSLIAGVVPAGESIEPATPDLELQSELARAPSLSALEHHVLEEMGDAHLATPFVRASRADVNTDRCRADTRQLFRKDDQPVRRCGPEQPFVESSRFHEGLLPGKQRLPG
jgi:hypothetical protein